MNIQVSNKFKAKANEDKNEVLVIENTEICHVGMNGNKFIFTEEELEKSVHTLDRVPLVANVTDYSDDHNTSAVNTVGWVYEPKFEKGSVFATLEITHPQIIEKIQRKTTKGEREINFVSMGCNASEVICSICGSEIYLDSYQCDKGHVVGQRYDGQECGMIGKGITFEHVALTNVPADKEAKLGREVVMMYANKKELKIKAELDEEKKKEEEVKKEEVKENQEANKTDTPAEEKIQPSDDKLIEALKDKLNILESEVEKIKEVVSGNTEQKQGENMEENKVKNPEEIKAQEEVPEEVVATEEVEEEEKVKATEEKTDEEKKQEARMNFRNKLSASKGNRLLAMYKKLCEKRFGPLPTMVAKSSSLSFVKAFYSIKAKKNGNVMRGNVINAMKNNRENRIKAAMEDRTGKGYKELFKIAKEQ